MLSLNLTFIVQIINFFIAWWLFDKVFLRSAYTLVMKEEVLEAKVQEDQRHLSQHLNERQRFHENMINMHNQQFISMIPVQTLETHKVSQAAPEIEVVAITQEQHDALADECSRALVHSIIQSTEKKSV